MIEPSIRRKHTALPTPSGLDELKRNRCRKLHNSLFTKEFSVSTAPEVGRIIDFQNLPSTSDYAFLSEGAFLAVKRGIRRVTGGNLNTNMSVRKIQYKLKEYRQQGALPVRLEMVHSVDRKPSPISPPEVKKQAVFAAKAGAKFRRLD
jgi:hypothetical protein